MPKLTYLEKEKVIKIIQKLQKIIKGKIDSKLIKGTIFLKESTLNLRHSVYARQDTSPEYGPPKLCAFILFAFRI